MKCKFADFCCMSGVGEKKIYFIFVSFRPSVIVLIFLLALVESSSGDAVYNRRGPKRIGQKDYITTRKTTTTLPPIFLTHAITVIEENISHEESEIASDFISSSPRSLASPSTPSGHVTNVLETTVPPTTTHKNKIPSLNSRTSEISPFSPLQLDKVFVFPHTTSYSHETSSIRSDSTSTLSHRIETTTTHMSEIPSVNSRPTINLVTEISPMQTDKLVVFPQTISYNHETSSARSYSLSTLLKSHRIETTVPTTTTHKSKIPSLNSRAKVNHSSEISPLQADKVFVFPQTFSYNHETSSFRSNSPSPLLKSPQIDQDYFIDHTSNTKNKKKHVKEEIQGSSKQTFNDTRRVEKEFEFDEKFSSSTISQLTKSGLSSKQNSSRHKFNEDGIIINTVTEVSPRTTMRPTTNDDGKIIINEKFKKNETKSTVHAPIIAPISIVPAVNASADKQFTEKIEIELTTTREFHESETKKTLEIAQKQVHIDLLPTFLTPKIVTTIFHRGKLVTYDTQKPQIAGFHVITSSNSQQTFATTEKVFSLFENSSSSQQQQKIVEEPDYYEEESNYYDDEISGNVQASEDESGKSISFKLFIS